MLKGYNNLCVTAALVFMLTLWGCEQSDSDESHKALSTDSKSTEMKKSEVSATPEVTSNKLTLRDSTVNNDGIFDIVTTDYKISAPSKMQKGWTTFRFKNEGQQVHFVAMYRLVDGKTIDDQLKEVAPLFVPLMNGLRSGEMTKSDIGPFFEENMPEWGLRMTWVGGAALLSPGKKTESSFYIPEAGTYLLECYVKAPNGQWHTLMGMMTQVEVSDTTNKAIEPKHNHKVIVSNEGINAPDTLKAGEHSIKIVMQDDPEPLLVPYDLNLAKLEDDTDLDKLYFWMDWTNVGGLRAPAPVEFIGGLEHMNGGNHGYIKVNLDSGRYIWISEVNAAKINKVFIVQ